MPQRQGRLRDDHQLLFLFGVAVPTYKGVAVEQYRRRHHVAVIDSFVRQLESSYRVCHFTLRQRWQQCDQICPS